MIGINNLLLEFFSKNYFFSKIFNGIYIVLQKSYQYNINKKYRSKYNIAPSFFFTGDDVLLEGEGEIILGEKSRIGRRCWLSAVEGTTISVGKNTRIGPNTTMLTSNTKSRQDFSKSKDRSTGNISIGNHCWIGVNTYIKEGVSIGNNCIIGANSVVTKNIPSNSLVTGANVVRDNYEKY